MTVSLSSLPDGYHAIVIGASGGIGGALARLIHADPRCGTLMIASRSGLRSPGPPTPHVHIDFEDPPSIPGACVALAGNLPLHLVIVATGVLSEGDAQPEKSWRTLKHATMARTFEINTIGPALVASALLDRLDRTGKSVFAVLSARVGSITDNRLGGWHSYRASKAALNMLIRTFAIELERRNPAAVCAALHPGTVETDLSRTFLSGAARALTPDESAAALLGVIDRLEPRDSGGLFAWSGESIPY